MKLGLVVALKLIRINSMKLKQKCGIAVQQYQKWLKRAKDLKCEAFFITFEHGDNLPYPYHIDKREHIASERKYLEAQDIEILLEVMI